MMKAYDDYLQLVNRAIADIDYPQQPQLLYQPIAYTMALGGKRLRPVLTLMACEAMGGDLERALPAALGIELFHNFTLLHDDVMDRADMRRGQPTVHCRWNDNVAILSGDAMLTLATQTVARTEARHLPAVIDLFNRTAMQIYEGQQWDMDFELRTDVTQQEYIDMIRLKTSVLLGCACQMGAIVADASQADAQALYDMGVSLGLAFQLQDDMLDVWGDPETFGKQVGGDIINNKKTFLLINAINRATGDDARRLRHWLDYDGVDRQAKYQAVRAIYERLGLRQLSQQAIDHHTTQSLKQLQSIGMPPQAAEAFAHLINRLVNRDH